MAVVVNGNVIPEREIELEMQYHPASSAEEARQAAARALVIRRLLLERAEYLGLRVPDPLPLEDGQRELPEEAIIRTLVEREVHVPEPDLESCRRYYEANRKRFRSTDIFEAAHILAMADPKDPEMLAAARARIEEVLRELVTAPGRFAALAEQHSDCPSAKQGGNLGQVTRESIAPEVASFLLAMEEGQLSPVPVRSRFGYHALRLDRRVPGKELPFELVQERIADFLRERAWQTAVRQYLKLLVGQAEINGIELEGASSPLVQ